jgi:putative NIF3 family GTP cyclohydrolase 1 type 2
MEKDQLSLDVQGSRRAFIRGAAGVLAALALEPVLAKGHSSPARQYTVQEVIDIILKAGGLSVQPGTVDTLKSGTVTQTVTGIVTTMFATVAVIEEAVKRKANFIIAHEPTFYNHSDNTEWVRDNDIVKQKQALLEKHGIAVWRFHDYCHTLKPDAIRYGVARKAGWLSHFSNDTAILTLPVQTLKELAGHLKTSLGITHVRVIGDADKRCGRIALLPGAWGGQRQVSIAEAEHPDVLIAGEVVEWETAEYIRDACRLNKGPALIVLGHAASEEPGMEYVAEWLGPKLPGVKISHVASGDVFSWW